MSVDGRGGSRGAGRPQRARARPTCSKRMSFLSPGRGLRRATLEDVADNAGRRFLGRRRRSGGRAGASQRSAPASSRAVETDDVRPQVPHRPRAGVVPPSAFGDHLRLVWLTPTMDGLFLGRRLASGGGFSIGSVLAIDSDHTTPRVGAGAIAALAQPPAGRRARPIRIGLTRSSTRPPNLPSPSPRCAPKR